MTRVLLSIVSLLCVLDNALAGEHPLHVTVQQLLATPQKFAGKRVDVAGWYIALHEDSQLYAKQRRDAGQFG